MSFLFVVIEILFWIIMFRGSVPSGGFEGLAQSVLRYVVRLPMGSVGCWMLLITLFVSRLFLGWKMALIILAALIIQSHVALALAKGGKARA